MTRSSAKACIVCWLSISCRLEDVDRVAGLGELRLTRRQLLTNVDQLSLQDFVLGVRLDRELRPAGPVRLPFRLDRALHDWALRKRARPAAFRSFTRATSSLKSLRWRRSAASTRRLRRRAIEVAIRRSAETSSTAAATSVAAGCFASSGVSHSEFVAVGCRICGASSAAHGRSASIS